VSFGSTEARVFGIRDGQDFEVPILGIALKRFVFKVEQEMPTPFLAWFQEDPVFWHIIEKIAEDFVEISPRSTPVETAMSSFPSLIVRITEPISPTTGKYNFSTVIIAKPGIESSVKKKSER